MGLRVKSMAVVTSGNRVLALRIMRVSIRGKLSKRIRDAKRPCGSLGCRLRRSSLIRASRGHLRRVARRLLPLLLRRSLNGSAVCTHRTIRRVISWRSRLRLRVLSKVSSAT